MKKKKASTSKAFGAAAVVMFFLIIGTVGAMECGNISLLAGTIRAFGFMALWAVLTYLAGGFKRKE